MSKTGKQDPVDRIENTLNKTLDVILEEGSQEILLSASTSKVKYLRDIAMVIHKSLVLKGRKKLWANKRR